MRCVVVWPPRQESKDEVKARFGEREEGRERKTARDGARVGARGGATKQGSRVRGREVAACENPEKRLEELGEDEFKREVADSGMWSGGSRRRTSWGRRVAELERRGVRG